MIKEYTYKNINDKYQLYFVSNFNGKDELMEYIVFKEVQPDLVDVFKNEYNAIFMPTSVNNTFYKVLFNNRQDLNRVIDYLESLEVLKKLKG